jgi:hypothetical protein
MSKHTAGPWFYEKVGRWQRDFIRGGDGKRVAAVYRDTRRMFVGEPEANAHLIAAAPELLGAGDEGDAR